MWLDINNLLLKKKNEVKRDLISNKFKQGAHIFQRLGSKIQNGCETPYLVFGIIVMQISRSQWASYAVENRIRKC